MATQNHKTSGAKSQGSANSNHKFVVTVFADTKSFERIEGKHTVETMAKYVRVKHAPSKRGLRLWKLGRFGELKSPNGSLRWGENMVSVSGCEADYDGEVETVEWAADRLREAGVKALLFESPSATPEKPRWRVICPFSKELPVSERKPLVARLNGFLNGCLGGEFFVDTQIFYYGKVDGTPDRKTIIVEGEFLDLVPGVEVYPPGKAPRDKEERDPAEPLRWLSEDGLKQIVALLDPDMKHDEGWKTVCFAISTQTQNSEEGWEIFNEWCARGSNYNEGVARRLWEDAPCYPVSPRALLKMARAKGGTVIEPPPSAEELGFKEIVPNYEELI